MQQNPTTSAVLLISLLASNTSAMEAQKDYRSWNLTSLLRRLWSASVTKQPGDVVPTYDQPIEPLAMHPKLFTEVVLPYLRPREQLILITGALCTLNREKKQGLRTDNACAVPASESGYGEYEELLKSAGARARETQKQLDTALAETIINFAATTIRPEHAAARIIGLVADGATINHNSSPFALPLSDGQLREIEMFLCNAIRDENTHLMDALLTGGLNPNRSLEWPCSHTLASLAVQQDKASMISILAKHGADLNAPDHLLGSTPLTPARQFRSMATLQALIDHGADVNKPNRDGTTPLSNALRFHDFDAVKLLLKHGANPNQRERKGLRPLQLLRIIFRPVDAHQEAKQAEQLLIQHGARTSRGNLILDFLASDISFDPHFDFVRAYPRTWRVIWFFNWIFSGAWLCKG